MEPEPVNRTLWIALGIAGAAVLVIAAIVFDLGPVADDDLSEAEFLARGDDICAQAHSDYTKLQGAPPRTASEAAELTEELLAISRDELDAIRDLEAPASLDTALARYLRAREAGIEKLRAGNDAADDGDALAYAKAQAGVASKQLERRKLAAAVGFDECSRILFGREQLASDSEVPLDTDPSAPPTVSNPPTASP